jgi:DNA repair protein RadC
MQKLHVKQANGRYRVATSNEIREAASEYVRASQLQRGTKIGSPGDTHAFLREAIGALDSELFGAILLDNRHRVISFETLFRGTIDGCSVYPREVVKRVLDKNAAAVILAHNHPSGVAEPSQADERITARIKSALELIDVRLLDHIVVGETCTSLASRGLL